MAGYGWAGNRAAGAPHSGWAGRLSQTQSPQQGASTATQGGGTDPRSAFYQLAYQTYGNDPNMLANLQSASFSSGGFERLPGATDQDKASYLLNYLSSGAKQGLSAYDMISGRHDSDLVNARPMVGGQQITDPAAAANRLGTGGGYDMIKGNVSRDQAAGYTNPAYANFWGKYGATAPAQATAGAAAQSAAPTGSSPATPQQSSPAQYVPDQAPPAVQPQTTQQSYRPAANTSSWASLLANSQKPTDSQNPYFW